MVAGPREPFPGIIKLPQAERALMLQGREGRERKEGEKYKRLRDVREVKKREVK